jgi:hypothetical protein
MSNGTLVDWTNTRDKFTGVKGGDIISFTTKEIAFDDCDAVYTINRRGPDPYANYVHINYDRESHWRVDCVESGIPEYSHIWKKYLPIGMNGVVRIYLSALTPGVNEKCMWCINITHGCISDSDTGRPLAYLVKLHKYDDIPTKN